MEQMSHHPPVTAFHMIGAGTLKIDGLGSLHAYKAESCLQAGGTNQLGMRIHTPVPIMTFSCSDKKRRGFLLFPTYPKYKQGRYVCCK